MGCQEPAIDHAEDVIDKAALVFQHEWCELVPVQAEHTNLLEVASKPPFDGVLSLAKFDCQSIKVAGQSHSFIRCSHDLVCQS